MSNPSLSRSIEGFLLNVSAAGRSPYTIRNYRTELGRFLKFVGDKEVNKIQSSEMENYLLYLKNDFLICKVATTPIPPRKLSQKTLSNAHGILAGFWKWAAKEFLLPNPFKVPPIKAYIKPISPLRENEIALLIGACVQTNKHSRKMNLYSSARSTAKRDKAIILTLLDSGMRVSEMCGILIKDYDQENGRLLITGKGSKTRFVYLGRSSRQALWSYLLERYPSQKPNKDDPLFAEMYGMYPLTTNGILQLLKRLGTRA